jgi:hypothetical protein
LWQNINEISEPIEIRIVNTSPPSHKIYLYFWILLVSWSLPAVSLFRIGFLWGTIGFQDMFVEAIII